MRRFFFDTSALLKIYHREEGSDVCLDIYNSSDEITVSELARVELHSTLYRKHREGNLKARALDAVLKRFSSDQESRFEVLDITSLVFDEACRLLSVHSRSLSLRTLDSLQAAAFLAYCEVGQDCFVEACGCFIPGRSGGIAGRDVMSFQKMQSGRVRRAHRQLVSPLIQGDMFQKRFISHVNTKSQHAICAISLSGGKLK